MGATAIISRPTADDSVDRMHEPLEPPPARQPPGRHRDEEVAARRDDQERAERGEGSIEVGAHVRPGHTVGEVGQAEDDERDREEGRAR